MLFFEFSLELVVVSDDAVVDDCDTSTVVKVRMSINIRLITMSSPPRVSNRDIVIMLRSSLH